MLLDKTKVMAFLPHRDPFLFIDAVENIEVEGWKFGNGVLEDAKKVIGSTVKAKFFADPGLEIFKGHFPGRPVLPGVIQVEMMAQASSFVMVAIIKDIFTQKENNLELALVAVTEAKFRKPVLPGMDLNIRASCTRYRPPIMACDCQIFCNGELMSEASILATVKY